MLLFLLAAVGTAAGAIYVDATAVAGAKDGTSWADAYIYLQDALAEAITEPNEIWVAQGTYRPDHDSANPTGSKQRTATFQLLNDVEIYGGFPPDGSLWGDRDPNAYLTILTGDLNGDDGPDFINNGDNSYHVVTATGTSATAVLDGFTITAGNANTDSGANSYGGGIYNDGGNTVIANCTITGNWAMASGGGMYNDSSSATVENCTFSHNSSGSLGGGMYNYWSDWLVISGCTFIQNSAGDWGGGVFNENSNPMLTVCKFTANQADSYGGGMYNYDISSPTLTNCTFTGNLAGANFTGGGGMFNYWYSSPTMINCLFNGNQADFGGGIYNEYYCDVDVLSCTLSGNSAGYGGGIYNYLSDPTLTNCILWGNNTSFGGNEIYNNPTCTPTISYCDIYGSGGSGAGWDPNLGTDGGGNIGDNPLFIRDPNDGGDGWGDDPCTPGVDEGRNNDYGDLRLSIPGSPCVDSGSNPAVPADAADLDGDGNTAEKTPWDLDGNARILDGNGDSTATVDMGAWEFAQAFIARTPAQFTFFVARPSFDSEPQSLYISNSGAGQLNWQITCGCNWLDADPNSGSSTASPDEVLLTTDTSSLAWGSYSCQLTISSPDVANSPQTVQVDLNIIIKADFDADGDVDLVDFGMFALAWLKAQGQDGYNPVCDIAEPSNNFIDEADLAAFGQNWLYQ